MSKLLFIVVCTVGIFQNVFAEKEVQNKSRQKRSTADDGTSACANDYVTTSVCVACADLPPGVGLPLDACCKSKLVQMMCAACLMDLDSCAKEIMPFKSDEIDPEMFENEEDEMNLSKRYGRLFMGNSPLPNSYHSSNEKRFGRLFVSSNPYYQLTNPDEKRFGTLFMGSRPGINYGRNYESDRNKRYGTLFMKKRYGRLFLGTGYGRILNDKRSIDEDDDLPIDLSSETRSKRFGRLFLSRARLTGSRDKKSS